jgi:dihydroorotate dehydrogenase (fumarate)
MTDLSTTYLGLPLATPIVASAGPVTGNLASAIELAEAGVGAIVLPSLFEEEIVREEVELNLALEAGANVVAEATTYFPNVVRLATPAERYVTRLAAIKQAVDVPVIASLNADSDGSWTAYAALLAEAGADAIELNLYTVAADPSRTAADVEADLLDIVRDVRIAVDVPLAVKLSPYFSSLANFARRVVVAGADGLVLFNRFYQPDMDLESLEVVPRVELSSRWELRAPLRWIAILRPLLGSGTSLAATSGVHQAPDALKAIAAGADVAMMTSALLRHGPSHVRSVTADLAVWLEEHEYDSVAELRGCMSHAHTAQPSAFERANYVDVLHSWRSPG